jgi:thymidylate synthase
MKQYHDLLKNIIKNGVEKESGRANMPNTIGISHGVIQMNLQEGFPLLTTKKMHWKGIVHELLWFLRGETNIKYLVDNNTNIWNGDALRWYNDIYVKKHNAPNMSMDEFIENVKKSAVFYYPSKEDDCEHCSDHYTYGDLGKVYGFQWRNQNGVDQIKEVMDGLKNNPYSRYHIIDAWNKADFKDMALPPCHLLYQFIVRPIDEVTRWNNLKARTEQAMVDWKSGNMSFKQIEDKHNEPRFYLDLNMYQRSCDTFLGVPFNIASMSLLLMLFAKANNMIAGQATWIGGDTHLYVDHIPAVNEQLSRETYELPKLIIKKELNSLENILALTIDDFELADYVSHASIKAELFTGLKK